MQQVHPLFVDPLHAPANNQALNALVHIRDNLLFSLISELSYNRFLLNRACF